MINLLLSISLIFTPVLPENIPAQLIYLGKGVDPIHSIKVERGYIVDTTSILLTPYNFVRLKSILEGSPDLCTYAIDEAIKACQNGMIREQEIALDREHNDSEIIKAYEVRLNKLELSLEASQNQRNILLWSIGGVSLIAVASTSLLIWGL